MRVLDHWLFLCMGNGRVWLTVRRWSLHSTRNFPEPFRYRCRTSSGFCGAGGGGGADRQLPTPEEYQTFVAQVDKTAVDTCRYLNFGQLSRYAEREADGLIFRLRCNLPDGVRHHTTPLICPVAATLTGPTTPSLRWVLFHSACCSRFFSSPLLR